MEYKGVKNDDTLRPLNQSSPIKVIVGAKDNTKTWLLPQDLLTHVSPFFKAALTGHFAEASLRTVNLPEDSIDAFELFVRWLDDGEILAPSWATPKVYIKAWIMGDKLSCPMFQDLTMLRLLFHHTIVGISAECIKCAYEETPVTSKLRQWAVDQFLWDTWTASTTDETDKTCISYAGESSDFGSDFLRAYLKACCWRGNHGVHGEPKNPHECSQDYLLLVTYTE